MPWQDRPYYRDRSESRTNPLMWLLTGSVPLFTVFGIRVRMHASMILLIVLELALSQTTYGLGVKNAFTALTILFCSVLLHEFGHCFGARYVGGDADEILMWPLGGLAFTNPPKRPWPSFFTTAAGPAVNLLLCLLTGVTIALLHSVHALPWFPVHHPLRMYVWPDSLTYYLWWIFIVNYGLLIFNLLLLFYPFDGGRMVQELLWVKIGYYRSMLIATTIGMPVAIIVVGVGVALLSLFTILLGAFGFHSCYRQRQMLREMGPEEWNDGPDYSAAYERPTTTRRRRRVSSRLLKKVRRRAQLLAEEKARVDAILVKVSRHGIASLNWRERRVLRKATEHQRQRDVEFSGEKP
jgi:stage IV sporulation protein FB